MSLVKITGKSFIDSALFNLLSGQPPLNGYWSFNQKYYIDGQQTTLDQYGTGLYSQIYYLSGLVTTLDLSGTGTFLEVYYVAGEEANGIFNNLYYVDGVYGTGTFESTYYVNGSAAEGTYNNTYYVGGSAANGYYGSTYYIDGTVTPLASSGTGTYNNFFYVDGQKATGVYEGIYYVGGSRFSGTYLNIIYVDGSPLNGLYEGVWYINGVATTLNLNGFGYWNGLFYMNGAIGNGGHDGVYYIDGVATSLSVLGNGIWNDVYYSLGVPATGVYNGTYYVDGVAATGTVGGIYYVDGSPANGYYSPYYYISGEETNLSSSGTGTHNGVYYNSGTAANGVYNGTYYVDGVAGTGTSEGVYYVSGSPANGVYNGTYYASGVAGTGSSGGIYYVDGSPANGTYNSTYYVDGSPANGNYNDTFYYEGSAFTPTNVSGLKGWYDATSSLYDSASGGSLVTTNNTAVARWEDKSGNANHLVQNTVNSRPLYKTSAINSKAGLYFDGTDDTLPFTGSGLSIMQNVSGAEIFAVASYSSSVAANPQSSFKNVVVFSNNTSNIARILIGGSTTYNQFRIGGRRAEADIFVGSVAAGLSASEGVIQNSFVNYIDGTQTTVKNGNRIATNILYTKGSNTPNTASLSASIGSGSFIGHLSEVLIFNRILTDIERNAVEKYLSAKWSVSVKQTFTGLRDGVYYVDGVATTLSTAGAGYWNGVYYINGIATTLDSSGNGYWQGYYFTSGSSTFSPLFVYRSRLHGAWFDASFEGTDTGSGGLYDATSGGNWVSTNDTAVARWEDKTSNSYNITQSTSSKRAKLITNEKNSNGVVRFDGTDDAFSFSGGALSLFKNIAAADIFVVSKPTATGARTSCFFSMSGSTTRLQTGISNTDKFTTGGRRVDSDAFTSASSTTTVLSSWKVAHASYNYTSGSITVRVNGTQESTASMPTSGNTGNFDSAAARLGCTYTVSTSAESAFFQGDIGEILIFADALTTAERTSVQTYLSAKWAIA